MWVKVYQSSTGTPGTFKLECVSRATAETSAAQGTECFLLSLLEIQRLPLRTPVRVRDDLWLLAVESGAVLPPEIHALLYQPDSKAI